MVKPELLAPVGSWDALVAALTNGADAVYLGGKQFNARAYASNFDEGQMERAVKVAHRFGAKVFVTMNTLLREDEIRVAGPYVRHLYEVGVDAMIIQDLGLLSNLRELVPHMELHASTQMTVHNTEGAKLLKDKGISRVVLARELSFDQVKRIKENADVEIETFVHGALCFAYSGQCLMSSIIGGRSGNRGRCAQPCRLPYELQRGDKTLNDPSSRYTLSPRDLNHVRYLKRWVDAGISALKIEGRMKRPEYVATVVRVYRQALDLAIGGGESAFDERAERDLAAAFNRRFTPGLAFTVKGPEMMSSDRPDNRGLPLGKVIATAKGGCRVQVLLDEPLHGDDQCELWSPGGQRITIERLPYASAGDRVWLEIGQPVDDGSRLYRMVDAELWQRAQASYQDWELLADQHRAPLNITVKIATGEPVVLVGSSQGGFARITSDQPVEPALHRPLGEDTVVQAFTKLTDTPFTLADCQVEIKGEPKVSIGVLNGLRRRLVEQLVRGKERTPLATDWEKQWPMSLPKRPRPVGNLSLAVAVGETDAALAVMENPLGLLIFGGDSYRQPPSISDFALIADRAKRTNIEVLFALPRITTDQQLQAQIPVFDLAQRHCIPVMVANLGQYQLAMEHYPNLLVYLHWALNLFNPWAVDTMLYGQVVGMMPSPELTLNQIADLTNLAQISVGAMVGGRIPLMVSEHCLRKNAGVDCSRCSEAGFTLKDRYGVTFPVRKDQYCRSHILNSQDLCLVEHFPALAKAGINHLVVEGRSYDPDTVKAVTGIWAQALAEFQADPIRWKERGQRYRALLEKYSPGGVTKGHFFRGVE